MKRTYISGFEKRKKKQKQIEASISGSKRITEFLSTKPSSSITTTVAGASHTVVSGETVGDIDSESIQDDVMPETENLDQVPIQVEILRDSLDSACEYPTDRGHFPDTITNIQLKECIVQYGPCQPKGPFPNNPNDENRPRFCDSHYYFYTTGNLKVKRHWLCYSPKLQMPYCEVCWLFADRSQLHSKKFLWNWVNGISGSAQYFGQKIKKHETSATHKAATIVYQHWQQNKTIDAEDEKNIRNQASYWRQVVHRLITIILTLATNNLAFRGHREHVGGGECEGGNFLALVEMMSQYDPVLKELINLPARAPKYLSPQIQNEIIQLLGNAVRKQLVADINAAPFFSIILDTTSDITHTDHLSVIIRWVEIDCDRDTIDIQENFLGFITVDDATAQGLTTIAIKHVKNLGLDLQRIRGQGYDGASVMSGVKGGVQRLLSQLIKDSPVPYVHCSSHNLNLVINDAVSANINAVTFFGTLAELYSFFGSSLSRWSDLIGDEQNDKFNSKGLTLKKLCSTRWTSRLSSVRAVRCRYKDILRVLTKLSLTSSKAKEKSDAFALKKQIETFEFVVFVVLWERLLHAINKASFEMQSPKIDLSAATHLLSMAYAELKNLRNSWDGVLLTAEAMGKSWGIECEFSRKRARRVKSFFDELASDERLDDPEKAFKVHIFYCIIDTAMQQLSDRFTGQKLVSDTFSFLYPKSLLSLSDQDLENAATALVEKYSKDVSENFVQEVVSFRREFKDKIIGLKTITDILQLLIKSNMFSLLPELATVCVLFATLPVTVASAERSFSKLKLIKSYLRTSICQERLDGLALLSIEHNLAKALDKEKLITDFSNLKARKGFTKL